MTPAFYHSATVLKTSIVEIAMEAEDLDEWFQIKSWDEVRILVNEIYEAEFGPQLRAHDLLDEIEDEIEDATAAMDDVGIESE